MGKARDAYGLVLGQLRSRFDAGLMRPGALLAINDLAEQHRTSTTPVREALVRLSGEGLVLETRGRGFACAPLDATRLRDLYDAHALLMAAWTPMAGRDADASPTPATPGCAWPGSEASDGARLFDAVTAVFRSLAEGGANRVLTATHRTLLAQLAWSRRTELERFPQARREAYDVARAHAAGRSCDLADALRLHLHRRGGRIPSLLLGAEGA